MGLRTCPHLHAYAELIGVRLVHHTGGIKGKYFHHTRTISTRRGMSIQQYKSTLAHELAHATYGDIPTGNGYFDQRQEMRADQWAANALIDPTHFRDAYLWHGGHLPAVADELEVTQHLLKRWLKQHTNDYPRENTKVACLNFR